MMPAYLEGLQIHEDSAFFREAVRYTAQRYGFNLGLVEKDYFCTLLLAYLTSRVPDLVFKGGTCLSKVHVDFFRLSEDLDFTIPTRLGSSRGERSRKADGVKEAVSGLSHALAVFRSVQPLTGANNSTQYIAIANYSSLLTTRPEKVKVEVGLREPLAVPSARLGARTLLLNPVNGEPLLPELPLPCLSLREAYAEKCRAALTRKEVAIRDYFDLDHAMRRNRFHPEDAAIIELVKAKLAVPGTGRIDVSAARFAQLRLQRESELRPVLREDDYMAFDLERIWEQICAMAKSLADS